VLGVWELVLEVPDRRLIAVAQARDVQMLDVSLKPLQSLIACGAVLLE